MTNLGESFLKQVNSIVGRSAYSNIHLLNIAKLNGNIITYNNWKSDYSEFMFSLPENGFLGLGGAENSGDIGSDISEKTATLLTVAGRLHLSRAQVAQMQQSSLGVNISPEDFIANQMHGLLRQIEGVLACGQAGRYNRDDDPLKKDTTDSDYTIKGLLFDSNVQTIAGGTGEDDDVTAFGDFYDTMVKIQETMVDGGVDTTNVFVFMDTSTMSTMLKSKSTNIWEVDQIKKSFPGWTFLVNNHLLATNLTSNHYIWAIAPKDTLGAPTFRVVETYPLSATPVGGGTLQSNDMYEWIVAWKGGVVVRNGYGIVKTGALTIA